MRLYPRICSNKSILLNFDERSNKTASPNSAAIQINKLFVGNRYCLMDLAPLDWHFEYVVFCSVDCIATKKSTIDVLRCVGCFLHANCNLIVVSNHHCRGIEEETYSY